MPFLVDRRPRSEGARGVEGRFHRARDRIGLTEMHEPCIFECMRTTINIDDELIEKARELTGIREKTTLVRRGLEALIALESARRLARLGGSEPDLEPVPRRRPA